jgi:GDP-mannose 6-dehydrogenase
MTTIVITILEEFSGKKAGMDFGVANNPEFLREGSAVKDFRNPAKTVKGELDAASGGHAGDGLCKARRFVDRDGLKTAEMAKYVYNRWHALKIGFANEIGTLCKSLGPHGHEIMTIFCQNHKLNISTAYHCSCLPKNLRALLYKAQDERLIIELPILTPFL